MLVKMCVQSSLTTRFISYDVRASVDTSTSLNVNTDVTRNYTTVDS